MIKEWSFKLGEKAILNENVKRGLPYHIGELVEVTEVLLKPTYDYRVRLPDGTNTKVKEKELTKIDQNDRILDLEVNGLAIYSGELVKVLKIDYLYKHVEIEHNDGSMEVIENKYIKKVGV